MRIHNLTEGWSKLPPIDREKYQSRDGLEGPIQTKSGKTVYYDPKAGAYYDPDTDMYLSYDEWRQLDEITRSEWDENEAHNMHSENALELIMQFGDDQDKAEMQAIYDRHMEMGHIEIEDINRRTELVKKYFDQMSESELKEWAFLAPLAGVAARAIGAGIAKAGTRQGAKQLAKRSVGKKAAVATVMPPRAASNGETPSPMAEDKESAMQKALRSIEKSFGPERKKIDDQVMAMLRTVQMLKDPRWADRAWSNVEKYGISSKEELAQELMLMIKNEQQVDDDEIYGVERNIKQMQKAMADLKEDSNGLNAMANSRDRVQSTYAEILKRDAEQTEVGDYIGKSMTKAEVLKLIDMLEPQGYDKEFLLKDLAPIMPNESITEEQFDEAAGEKDACYHKVKARYKVWPSAYASGALVKCRKVGAANWGNKKKK